MNAGGTRAMSKRAVKTQVRCLAAAGRGSVCGQWMHMEEGRKGVARGRMWANAIAVVVGGWRGQ